MRYLTENNDYNIQYLHIPYYLSNDKGIIHGELLDKKTNTIYIDREILVEKLEPCLMKLGKRLIKRWQKQAK